MKDIYIPYCFDVYTDEEQDNLIKELYAKYGTAITDDIKEQIQTELLIYRIEHFLDRSKPKTKKAAKKVKE